MRPHWSNPGIGVELMINDAFACHRYRTILDDAKDLALDPSVSMLPKTYSACDSRLGCGHSAGQICTSHAPGMLSLMVNATCLE